ncbi:hypothetical protein [Xanthomarina gelatinilytica]|uniref:hypothetical protein n=1 Tax=Xanthomarina gelatinilytica TaxID=1137281 RepID=UPI003AA9D7D2
MFIQQLQSLQIKWPTFKRSGGFIPGINSSDTAERLDTVLSRITFPGSLFLAALSILQQLLFNSEYNSWAMFYGGTSLIIMVELQLHHSANARIY